MVHIFPLQPENDYILKCVVLLCGILIVLIIHTFADMVQKSFEMKSYEMLS